MSLKSDIITLNWFLGHYTAQNKDIGLKFCAPVVGTYFCAWLCSQLILSDSGSNSDSSLNLSTLTPTPTLLCLWLNRMYSILRRAIWCIYFLDFTFDCIRTGDTPISSPFAPTADAGGRDHRWFNWMWSACQSLNALAQSQTIAMVLKLAQIPKSNEIRSLNDASALSEHYHSAFLTVFQCFHKDG